jgi:hypothetical protein
LNIKSNQGIYAIMGFVWIGLALFGLIFEPEKRVIYYFSFSFSPAAAYVFQLMASLPSS